MRLKHTRLERIIENGNWAECDADTLQGATASPLLAKTMVDDLDKELERRGHRFVRYANDLRVHVTSERAGQRVLAGLATFLEAHLKLKVNQVKSSVQYITKATAVGFRFVFRKDGRIGIRVAEKAMERLRSHLRKLTARSGACQCRTGSNA